MAGQCEQAHSVLQVSAAPHHLLCRHLCEEEAVLPQLCQHCHLWRPRDIHSLCCHSVRALRLLKAAQCSQLLGKEALPLLVEADANIPLLSVAVCMKYFEQVKYAQGPLFSRWCNISSSIIMSQSDGTHESWLLLHEQQLNLLLLH